MQPAARWSLTVILVIAVACGVGYLLYRGSHTRPLADRSRRAITATSRARGRRALLVGCGRYLNPSIQPLEGPVNDVRLMQEVLVKHCGFSPDEIATLAGDAHAGDAPTRANIEREFQRLRATAQKDDQIVVLLAGHGSQQPNQATDVDDSEPDGLDEIFLPIDTEQWSSAGGAAASSGVVNAIIDDEIYRWTSQIAEKGATVWMIFDCCCAGTAIRGEYQETPRFVSAVGDLKVPEEVSARNVSGGAAATEGDESHWALPRLPSSGEGRIIAFYACQANESELELALPPATNDRNVQRAKHGLLTYALCCALSQPGGETLTYQDLARDVWLRYRAWGRASPTPFVDGAVDRRVLGERQANRRFRVLRRSGGGGVIDAGGLQGLTPGSIVALYSSTAAAATYPAENDLPAEVGGGKVAPALRDGVAVAGSDRSVRHGVSDLLYDRPAGYARVTHVQSTTARIVPCVYGDATRAIGVEVGAWCDVVYADFGDMRLSLAIDETSAMRADQPSTALARLAEQLRSLSELPSAVFRVIDKASAADWVVQARESAIELLPRSAAELAEGEPLPLGTPHFPIDEADSAEAIAALLHRVFRAQNLIKLAGGSGHAVRPGRDALQLKVELLSQSRPLADAAVLVPGQEVEWKITNEGTAAVDLTLLFIDSQWEIAAAYPQPGQLADNRLAPGKSLLLGATVRGNTLGTEYLVAIASRGRGPQRDFRCLAGSSLDAARNLAAAVRGGEQDVFESPFGRLMRYALYNDESPGTARGLSSAGVDDCCLTLRAWVVQPDHTARGQE